MVPLFGLHVILIRLHKSGYTSTFFRGGGILTFCLKSGPLALKSRIDELQKKFYLFNSS
jgi:hypothetical protein